MARILEPLQLRAGPRIRLRRVCRSCLYEGPHRRSTPDIKADDRRRHCRYTLQTRPPLFRQRKR
jgi:hypothetical protein